jgi:hypothetical protein
VRDIHLQVEPAAPLVRSVGTRESQPTCFAGAVDHTHVAQVAYKTAWTAISSLLSQFSRDFGPQVLLHLNVAYFFPSIPVLLLQSAFQERMERRFGLAGSALARFCSGLGGLVLLTLAFPWFCHSEAELLSATVLVGVSYGVAFGTSYQLVSRFPKSSTVALTLGAYPLPPPACTRAPHAAARAGPSAPWARRPGLSATAHTTPAAPAAAAAAAASAAAASAAAAAAGFVSCGPVVLLFDLVCKSGPYYTASGLAALFRLVAVQTSLGLAAACWLLARHRRQLGRPRLLGATPLSGFSSSGKVSPGLRS